jgi:hypothetical protein
MRGCSAYGGIDEQGAAERDAVFYQCDDIVGSVKRAHEPCARPVAPQGADHSPEGAGERTACERAAASDGHRRPGERAAQEARGERSGRGPVRREGQLVGGDARRASPRAAASGPLGSPGMPATFPRGRSSPSTPTTRQSPLRSSSEGRPRCRWRRRARVSCCPASIPRRRTPRRRASPPLPRSATPCLAQGGGPDRRRSCR